MAIYPEHPYVHLFPPMSEDEYAALVVDVQAHGVRNPIVVTPDGYLIDGRHRQRACADLGIDTPVAVWDGVGDLLDYVLSTNLQRRHLSPTQKAELAVDLSETPGFLDRVRPAHDAAVAGGTREEQLATEPLAVAAREVGAGRGSAYAVAAARRTAPDLAQHITAGNVSARAAQDILAVRNAAGEEAAAVATERLIAGELDASRIRDITRAARDVVADGGDTAAASAAAARVAAGTPLMRVVHDHRRELGMRANQTRIADGTFFDEVKAGDKFSTVVIDPPWRWNDDNPNEDNQPGLPYGRGVPYATMTIPEIQDWDVNGLCQRVSEGGRGVGDLAEDNAHLWLWITNARLLEAQTLFDAWGFTYKGCLTWIKPRIGVGTYFRGSTEHILLGVRGSMEFLNRSTGSWFAADRGAGGHSSKPDEAYELIERCSPGPWVDVFGRRHVRPGWSVIGLDSGDDPGTEAALAARDARRTWRLVAEVPEGAEVAESGLAVAGD